MSRLHHAEAISGVVILCACGGTRGREGERAICADQLISHPVSSPAGLLAGMPSCQ